MALVISLETCFWLCVVATRRTIAAIRVDTHVSVSASVTAADSCVF